MKNSMLYVSTIKVFIIVISDEITIVDCDGGRPLRRHKCNLIALLNTGASVLSKS